MNTRAIFVLQSKLIKLIFYLLKELKKIVLFRNITKNTPERIFDLRAVLIFIVLDTVIKQ